MSWYLRVPRPAGPSIPMQARPKGLNLLFICSGNIMRSVISECVLRTRACELLGETAFLFSAESCGLEANPDAPPHEEAHRALDYLGVPLCDTGASPTDDERLARCDLAVTMTRQQLYVLASRFPEPSRKSFSLIELNGAIETLLEMRGQSLGERDWASLARDASAEELSENLGRAVAEITGLQREFVRPLPGVQLNIFELLTKFSPCFHQASGVHDPLGGTPEETLRCARLLNTEITNLLNGLFALALT